MTDFNAAVIIIGNIGKKNIVIQSIVIIVLCGNSILVIYIFYGFVLQFFVVVCNGYKSVLLCLIFWFCLFCFIYYYFPKQCVIYFIIAINPSKLFEHDKFEYPILQLNYIQYYKK